MLRRQLEAVATEAPDDRDRVADLLRLGSIVLVVVGHWMVATILVRDGQLVPGQLIAFVPETQPLTWLFQVMPVFFAVGGFVNAGSWGRARRRGDRWAVWVRKRSRRLLGPLVPLLALWVVLRAVLRLLDLPDDLAIVAAEAALLPVWFLAVYLMVIGLVPVTLALHRWAGVGALIANTDPPTLALWAFALAQIGVLMALRGRLSRWLSRDRVYGAVVLGGSVVLTVFLWHMTALVIVAAALVPTGVWPQFPTVDSTWWALRPVWLLACALVLAVLVALFRRFEELRDPVPRPGRLRAIVGLVATVVGIALVMTGGLHAPEQTLGLPLGALGLLLFGLGALGVLRPAWTRRR